MAANITVDESTGVTLNFRLEEAEQEIKQAIHAAVADATETLADAIRAEAPVGPATRHYPAAKDSIRSFVKEGKGTVHSEDFKSGWINIGTADRVTKKGASRGKMAANPYFRRGADKVREQLLARFEGIL